MKPRVLIVGTVPYNKKSTSRAFESYFSGWDRECLAQIFSHTKKPVKGHCSTFYQITDRQMIKKIYSKKAEVGIIYYYQELEDEWADNSLEIDEKVYLQMYKIGRMHTPLTHLIRKLVWRKKNWCSKKLNEWLDSFKPECVFLSFSDDFFISEIALYVAERFNIPIVSSIGDDYYFNNSFSVSPFYYLYKSMYRRLIRRVFQHKGSAIYISDKIRDKYNQSFHLKGETVYLTSEVIRKPFKIINKTNPVICYFGNIGAGRNHSLADIGTALGKIDSKYILNVYSNETDKKYTRIFQNNLNIRFHGSIPYTEVKRKSSECDVIVLVEGFAKSDVNKVRYSLSTKAADSLASGSNILVYGSEECGLIEYMESTNSATVCVEPEQLEQTIRKLFEDVKYQKRNYDTAIKIYSQNHLLDKSTTIFENIVRRVIEENNNEA